MFGGSSIDHARPRYTILSWSGGKDSALTYHRLVDKGYIVEYILNMNVRDAPAYHGPQQLVKAQVSQCLGVRGIYVDTSWRSYERDLLAVLSHARSLGVRYYATGDIYLEEHRSWNKNIASRAGLEHLSPIWLDDGEKSIKLVEEVLNLGVRAIIVRAVEGTPASKRVGEELTLDLAYEMAEANLDPAGERGEYHTVVVDAPFFRYRIELTCSRKSRARDPVTGNMYSVLDICGWRIVR